MSVEEEFCQTGILRTEILTIEQAMIAITRTIVTVYSHTIITIIIISILVRQKCEEYLSYHE